MAHDFPEIRRQNPISEVSSKRGLRLTRRGHEYSACCPFHDEKSASFTIFKDGAGLERFHCFSAACGAKGTVIDFVMMQDGVDVTTACAILGGEREAPTGSRPAPKPQAIKKAPAFTYGTAPADAPRIEAGKRTMELRNPGKDEDGKPGYSSYSPSMVFPYRDRDGALLGYVLRQDLKDGGKITPGIWWMRSEEEGFEGWCHGRPRPSPLYGIDQLAQNPEWQVIVVEGEKAADALRRLLNVCVVTWVGGSNGVEYADWSPLAGRNVVLWGDADQPGENAILGSVRRDAWSPGIAELIHEHGPASIRVAPWDKTKPGGWDAADAAAGVMTDKETGEILWQSETGPWTKREVAAWIQARAEAWTPKPAAKVMTMPEKPKPVEPKAEAATEARPMQQAKPSPQEIEMDELERKRKQKAREVEERRKVREEEEREAAWKAKLLYGKEEKLAPKSTSNLQIILDNHPDWRGVFAWDDFAQRVLIARRPVWEEDTGVRWTARALTDSDVTRTRAAVEHLSLAPNQEDCGRSIVAVAEKNKMNPLRDYLESLKWDGTPRLAGEPESAGTDRIPGWLTSYLGADDTPANRAFGLRWAISAAARVLRPGCKVDTMLILEGPQGLKKSTALRVLGTIGGKSYYTDEIAEINGKDAAMQLQGVWIVEIAEMNALGKAEVNSIKAWLTRQTDRFRPPYGKTIQEFPRACVLAGTVNPLGGGYLRDPTGGRRFWPVECKPVTPEGTIDIEALERDRSQLWAEAVHRLRAGEPWWLDADETNGAKDVQADRYEEDPWADKIDSFLEGRPNVRLSDIMTDCLSMAPKEQTPIVEKRVAGHLRARGWNRQKIRTAHEKIPKWAYVPPAA
jgi:predicted P-loop ATPase